MKLKDHYILDVYSAYKDKLDATDLISIDRALDKLPERRRYILWGTIFEGFTYDEIANSIHLTDQRAHRLSVDAIRKLRHYESIKHLRGVLGH